MKVKIEGKEYTVKRIKESHIVDNKQAIGVLVEVDLDRQVEFNYAIFQHAEFDAEYGVQKVYIPDTRKTRIVFRDLLPVTDSIPTKERIFSD